MNSFNRLFCVFLAIMCASCGAPKPTAVVESTVVPSEGTLLAVHMEQPWRYQHTSGVFSIDVPHGWSATDTSTSQELVVRFTDDDTNAAMLTNVLTVTRKLDTGSLRDLLREHLVASYGNEPMFAQEPPAIQQDGSQLIVWGCDASLADGTTTRLLGNSFIEQRGGHVSLLTVLVPSAQYIRLRPQIDALLNSYTVRGNTANSASVDELAKVEIGALVPYTDTTNLFRIDVPVGWTRELSGTEGQTTTIWSAPSGNAWLALQLSADDSQRSAKELGLMLTDVISEAFGTEAGFASDAPEPQDDGAVKIPWHYRATADNGLETPMFGFSFGMQRGEKVAIINASVPETQRAALEPQFDAIYKSFMVLP